MIHVSFQGLTTAVLLMNFKLNNNHIVFLNNYTDITI